jgi:hypothetical protein
MAPSKDSLMTYDPYSIPATDRTVPTTHNQDPFTAISQEINDLFDEAKNFADGEPITSPEMHDAVSSLYDMLHEAGKRADTLRVEEKKPLDDAVKAIQDRFNPFIQPKKGKVDLGKSALGVLLAAWRVRVAKEKEDAARKAREEADRIAAEAQAAIRASAGNLAAREEAEALLKEAKAADRFAKREDRQATTGTGLRSVWKAVLKDAEVALEWGWGRDAARFTALVQDMASEAVRAGARSVPGFEVVEERVV